MTKVSISGGWVARFPRTIRPCLRTGLSAEGSARRRDSHPEQHTESTPPRLAGRSRNLYSRECSNQSTRLKLKTTASVAPRDTIETCGHPERPDLSSSLKRARFKSRTHSHRAEAESSLIPSGRNIFLRVFTLDTAVEINSKGAKRNGFERKRDSPCAGSRRADDSACNAFSPDFTSSRLRCSTAGSGSWVGCCATLPPIGPHAV